MNEKEKCYDGEKVKDVTDEYVNQEEKQEDNETDEIDDMIFEAEASKEIVGRHKAEIVDVGVYHGDDYRAIEYTLDICDLDNWDTKLFVSIPDPLTADCHLGKLIDTVMDEGYVEGETYNPKDVVGEKVDIELIKDNDGNYKIAKTKGDVWNVKEVHG